jgi:Zn-dependent protease
MRGAEPEERCFVFRTWKLARVAGIDVSIHWSFTLLLAWLLLSSLMAGASAPAVAVNLLLTLSVFACVLLHEFGHALTARRFGINTRGIVLLPIGGVASLERMTRRPLEEFAIAIAGPLVNVFIAGALLITSPFVDLLATSSLMAAWLHELFGTLLWINIGLAVFNMLPAFPMDGGRVLRSVLALSAPYADATRTAVRIGRVMAIALGILGLIYSPILIMIAAFVFLAGTAEEQMVRASYVRTGRMPMYDDRHPTPAQISPLSSAGRSVVHGELLWPEDFVGSERTHRVIVRPCSWP